MAGVVAPRLHDGITLGLVIVFSLDSSRLTSTPNHTISPIENIVVGLRAVTIALVQGTGHDIESLKMRKKQPQRYQAGICWRSRADPLRAVPAGRWPYSAPLGRPRAAALDRRNRRVT
jgi:hypothetical protein